MHQKKVPSFVWLYSFYRKFIPNFSHIATPIIKLTHKNYKFEWSEECQIALWNLKHSLIILLLFYPDKTKPFILYTDKSDYCVGAVLTQPTEENIEHLSGIKHEKTIYFLCHKLSKKERMLYNTCIT